MLWKNARPLSSSSDVNRESSSPNLNYGGRHPPTGGSNNSRHAIDQRLRLAESMHNTLNYNYLSWIYLISFIFGLLATLLEQ